MSKYVQMRLHELSPERVVHFAHRKIRQLLLRRPEQSKTIETHVGSSAETILDCYGPRLKQVGVQPFNPESKAHMPPIYVELQYVKQNALSGSFRYIVCV